MSRKSGSFSAKLSLNIVIIVSIIFVTALGILAFTSHHMMAEEAKKSATNILKANISEIEKELQEVEIFTRGAAEVINAERDNQEMLYLITRRIVESSPNIIGSAIAFKQYYFPGQMYFSPYSWSDAEGVIHSKQLGNEEYDYFCMDWFQIPFLKGEACWSEPYYDDGGGEALMCTYSIPVKDENGEVYAILTADVTIDWISKRVSGIRPYKNSAMVVITRNGSYVGHPNMQRVKGETIFSFCYDDKDPSTMEIGRDMIAGRDSLVKVKNNNGDWAFCIYGPLSNGWSSAIICRYKDVLERSSKMSIILLIVGIIGLIVIFIVSYGIVRKHTRPLTEFSESAKSIAAGNFNTKLPEIKDDDEIKRLRDSFDYLQKSLAEYVEDLKKSTAANERYESELNIANVIQTNMVPHVFPNNGNIDIYGNMVPSKKVGGDLYDAYEKDGKIFIAIGDVSGKGMPASLFMATTRAILRFASEMNMPMDRMMNQLNDTVSSGNTTGMFVTMFVARYDIATRELAFCNAGHNPIIIAEPGKKARFLDEHTNIAVGVFNGFDFTMQSITIEPGTRILLYTDGVNEAEKQDKSQFGNERLLDWFDNVDKSFSAEQTTNGLFAKVREFTDGNEQNDDITILTVKF